MTTTRLPVLPRRADCTDCLLGQEPYNLSLKNRGIPTKPLFVSGKSRAILVIGATPSTKEDEQGEAFVGHAGRIVVDSYVAASGLPDLADVYATNVVRCYPASFEKAPPKALHICRNHLLTDIQEIRSKYSELILLCCGSEAIQAICGEALSLGNFPQGQELEVGGVTIRAFATFSSGMLLPGRSPAKLESVIEHLTVLVRYLKTGAVMRPPLKLGAVYGLRAPLPPATQTRFSIDTETIGCIGVQTTFHPERILRQDKCPKYNLMITAGLTWEDEEGRLRCRVFKSHKPRDMKDLKRILSRPGLVLYGHNTAYDILVLRALGDDWKAILHPDKVLLEDTMIWSFQDNPDRPERTLKALSIITGVGNYQNDPINLRKGQKYLGRDDPRLEDYQAEDCINTWGVRTECRLNITAKYGPDSPKVSERSVRWFSDLLWLGIEMSEAGLLHSVPALQSLHDTTRKRLDRLLTWSKSQFNLTLVGKGSVKDTVSLLSDLVEKWTPTEFAAKRMFLRQVVRTDVKKEVSTKSENVTLLLGVIPPDHEDARKLRALRAVRSLKKVVDSYTGPLLGLKAGKPEDINGKQLVDGYAWPSWHVVPSRANDNDSGEGGTQQGRMTARNPALATQPKAIERTWRSRFPGGCLIKPDESQIELRVPVIFCGDPVMLEIFHSGISLHLVTGSHLAGRQLANKYESPKFYAAGKMANFLRLFKGGHHKLQMALRADLRLDFTLEFCQAFLEADRQKYVVLYDWQDKLIETAKRDGYIQLPITGLSRNFLGDIDETYISTIVNFPVQTIAAQITESAQIEASRIFRKRKMRTLTCSNTYDEGIYDCPPEEVEEATTILRECFVRPPFYEELLSLGYHEVPLDVDVKTVYNPKNAA